MKIYLIFLLGVVAFLSCKSDDQKNESPKRSNDIQWINKYEVFDEPSCASIGSLKYYALLVSQPFLDTLVLLSLRQDGNSIQGFYKKVSYDQIPALFPNKVETKTFKYSTVRVLLREDQLDSVRAVMKTNDLLSLKDSIVTNATDGITKEIIVYNGEKFHNLYRGYVFEKDVESKFLSCFKQIMEVTIPK